MREVILHVDDDDGDGDVGSTGASCRKGAEAGQTLSCDSDRAVPGVESHPPRLRGSIPDGCPLLSC